MVRKLIGSRTGSESYFDMSGGYRIGDLAGAYVYLCDWRRSNPHSRLRIVWNRFAANTKHSRSVPMEWLFAGIADEISETQKPNERVPASRGKNLTRKHIWDNWFSLRRDDGLKSFVRIRPKREWVASARELLAAQSVPDKFVTVQPLFDATYNVYRNAPAAWWSSVAEESAKHQPTVMVINGSYRDSMTAPSGVYPIYVEPNDLTTALGLLSLSATHFGGETGLSLWAALLRTPVVAAYRRWCPYIDKRQVHFDFRPISFDAPVVFSQLEGDPVQAAETIKLAFSGQAVSSEDTPPVPHSKGL